MNQSNLRPDRPWPVALEVETVAISPKIDSEANWPQVEPLQLASVRRMESPKAADGALDGTSSRFVYRRDGHPNDRALADQLARLHGATRCVLTAQGMSSLAAVALATLNSGAKAWIAQELYGKTHKLFRQELARWGVDCQVFDPTCSQELDRLGGQKASLVVVETISNPCLCLPDLQRLSKIAHDSGALLLVDNTFASHLICRPLELGADLVMESLSKIVCGHSDSMLGMVCGRDNSLMASIASTISSFGMASSPLDCYLSQRGLATLGLRLARACETAAELAQVLSNCPSVLKVNYPGLSDHRQHELARRQLCGGFGWMLTFDLAGEIREAECRIEKLMTSIPFCPSLGDVQTTVSHPASTSHRGIAIEERQRLGIFPGTVRVSCGAEPTQWVVEQFLKAIQPGD